MSDLKTYRDKRDFQNTAEPRGAPTDAAGAGDPIFVIQQHDATSMHWDFRLEIDGVLVSWAVPKGPSTDPSEKRLAIHTEDHPLDYADFEGTIPEGKYGGGRVIVWDAGRYRNLKEPEDGEEAPSMKECLADGHLTVWLEGKKLRGGYALVLFREEDDQWLLVKMDDEGADARRKPTRTEPASVLSGRSIDELDENDENDDD